MSMTSTDVQALIAESMLESDAARIAAITRPTAPAGNTRAMKYGSTWSDGRSAGGGGATKYASSARPTNDRPNIHKASPAALMTNARRESASDLVVWNRWTITWSLV